MLKFLIKISFLTALVVGIVLMLQHVGQLTPQTVTMLKYIGLGALGLMALGIVSVTILGLTAIIMGLSFAKSAAGFGSGKARGAGGFIGETVGGAIRGALSGLGELKSLSSRQVELNIADYNSDSFTIKTLSGDLEVTGQEGRSAKAELEIFEKVAGDTEAVFEDGGIKLTTKSGKKSVIGSAKVWLPAKLARLSAESVNGDVTISDFATEGASFVKGVNGDISIERLKNSAEVTVKTVSGDVEIKESQFNSLNTQSVSGDVRIKDSAADIAVMKTVSGDIDYSGSDIKTINVKTVSGEVTK